VEHEGGALSNRGINTLIGNGKHLLGLLREQGRRDTLQKWSGPQKGPGMTGPGTYREALTNLKIAICKETYPEDRSPFWRYSALRRTPLVELPRLKSHRLEGGELIYTCVDQQSGQWLIKTIDHHELGSGGKLKATEAKNLPKPVKVALRGRENIAKNPEELLQWIKQLNPGLHTEYWRALDRQSEPKGLRLILLIDRGSYNTLKSSGVKY
jgi:hypothetical protein